MNHFKWKHFQPEMIVLTVRWYLKYSLSLRDLCEIMKERGLSIAHTTIMRWVHEYAPQIDKKIRPYLRPVNDSWRVDETYIKVNGKYMYLYRAVDSNGDTVEFMFSRMRDHKAAKRFFRKALRYMRSPDLRVITVDKNAAYPLAIQQLKDDNKLPAHTQMRQAKYLNNIVEQDHRFIRAMLGFKSFRTAHRILHGI